MPLTKEEFEVIVAKGKEREGENKAYCKKIEAFIKLVVKLKEVIIVVFYVISQYYEDDPQKWMFLKGRQTILKMR